MRNFYKGSVPKRKDIGMFSLLLRGVVNGKCETLQEGKTRLQSVECKVFRF